MTFVDSFYDSVVWWNGEFLAASKLAISPRDRGFQYGDGLFETIRVDHDIIRWLDDHLLRLSDSCSELNITLPGYDWDQNIFEVIELNRLRNSTARVKIIVTRGISRGHALEPAEFPSVLITAEKYVPPSDEQYKRGWKLCLSQSITTTRVSRFKSISYLPLLMAKQEARESGYDEILLTDTADNIAEGSSTSVLIDAGNHWIIPNTSMQLPGIARRKLRELMYADGISVQESSIHTNDVRAAKTIWLCNSMLGIMPVFSVEGRSLKTMRSVDASTFRSKLFPVQ